MSNKLDFNALKYCIDEKLVITLIPILYYYTCVIVTYECVKIYLYAINYNC